MNIFENAEFISCEDNNRLFSVMIENKGKIIFTGNTVPETYKMANRINLKNKCVVPAFGDTHIHFSSFSYFNAGLDCRYANDFNDLGVIINQHICNHKTGKVLLCFGKFADFVVLDQNPLKIPVEQIKNVKIEDLYMKGEKYKSLVESPYQLFLRAAYAMFTFFAR
ncbi:MAG: hypothetical protein OMM_09590 [Candidatus Magnetoglobus multicellularis str. Araruama]|uniref:Amidohydrolase 3 domain-containing protein n=1 Tax=Candidatus Magnetoglobus multicellularis str. Araruama TaxID=890399 RepID=A0A1V1P3I3_9BACT|nr:MAG: hypothetical protein OMM_09590 [Candidatus Magnetoglobus multicellularis str. Araruama]